MCQKSILSRMFTICQTSFIMFFDVNVCFSFLTSCTSSFLLANLVLLTRGIINSDHFCCALIYWTTPETRVTLNNLFMSSQLNQKLKLQAGEFRILQTIFRLFFWIRKPCLSLSLAHRSPSLFAINCACDQRSNLGRPLFLVNYFTLTLTTIPKIPEEVFVGFQSKKKSETPLPPERRV